MVNSFAQKGGGGRELVASRDTIGPWETFTVEISTSLKWNKGCGEGARQRTFTSVHCSGVAIFVDAVRTSTGALTLTLFEDLASAVQLGGAADLPVAMTGADARVFFSRSRGLDSLSSGLRCRKSRNRCNRHTS